MINFILQNNIDIESFEKQFIACEFMNKPLEKGDFDQMIEKYFSDFN